MREVNLRGGVVNLCFSMNIQSRFLNLHCRVLPEVKIRAGVGERVYLLIDFKYPCRDPTDAHNRCGIMFAAGVLWSYTDELLLQTKKSAC